MVSTMDIAVLWTGLTASVSAKARRENQRVEENKCCVSRSMNFNLSSSLSSLCYGNKTGIILVNGVQLINIKGQSKESAAGAMSVVGQ
jgi:hypothetical protein